MFSSSYPTKSGVIRPYILVMVWILKLIGAFICLTSHYVNEKEWV